ncbi:MAG: RNA polymerase sigma factor [Deltaproteobacteria bacterium]|nr:RNA polymerase sigma factor [Deltaproteobacteria bacterium]
MGAFVFDVGSDPGVLWPLRQVSDPGQLFALLERAQAGDVRARDAFLSAIYPIVAKHLTFVLKDHYLREEAAQESMIQILRAIPSFRLRVSARAWVLKIATRTAQHYRRRDRVHSSALTHDGTLPEAESPDVAEARVALGRLSALLETLPEEQREAFVLVKILQLTGEEAAEALSTPQNTVFSRVRLARQKLETAMSDRAEVRP